MANELYHHGILGMKWGIRRYQNEDGSLTPSGKKRYGREYERTSQKVMRKNSIKMLIEFALMLIIRLPMRLIMAA